MGRRDSRILVEFARLPWWVSAVVACAVYAAVRWLFPALAGSSRLLAPLTLAFSNQAIWVAALFLLPLPFALSHAQRLRRLV